MLTKLIKYEFKSTYARYLSAIAVYVLIAGFLMLFLRGNTGLTIGMTVLGLMALWVMTFVTIFQRYNGNLYGSEGYLMFTLPVRGSSLLLSKIIPAIVWLLALCIISGFTFFGLTFCYANLPVIGRMLVSIFAHLGEIMPYLAEMIVSAVFTLFAIFLSITVSKLVLWRKFGVVMGFVTYFVLDFIRSLPALILQEIRLGARGIRPSTF